MPLAQAPAVGYQSLMETRSNKALVFGVVIILLAALIGYAIWASPGSGKRARHYDMMFERSVAGLDEGASITFSGVAVGRVLRIQFDPVDPDIVRVRAVITDPKAPILQGTNAAIKRNLFGEAIITLDGARTGAPPILPARHGDIAIIPVKPQRGIMDDPASLVENISRTTDRLNEMLSPSGQRTISESIAKMEKKSAAMAARMPDIADKLADARLDIRKGAELAQAMGENADAMDRKLQGMRGEKVRELHAQMAAARTGLGKVNDAASQVRTKLQALEQANLKGKVHELSVSAAEFGDAVKKVDQGGVSALMSKPTLPDYKPAR
jgi:phospholipid/cholesterol/gamma-HCH transport system substrate-binding protein